MEISKNQNKINAKLSLKLTHMKQLSCNCSMTDDGGDVVVGTLNQFMLTLGMSLT